MKLILAIVLSLGLAQTASAGFGDFFKTKEISKRMLNTVIKNHLMVAKVTHPAPGLKLFDACFNGQNFVSKTGTKANRCVGYSYEVVEDTKYDIKPRTIKMCNKWEKYAPSASVNKTARKEVNCRWVKGMDLPFGHYAHSDSEKAHDMFNICDYKKVPTTFPLTQTIEVYSLYDNFSDKIYWHSSQEDRAQPGYQKFYYTIPYCEDLGDDDLPDTKK